MPIVTGLQYPENKPGAAYLLEAVLSGATQAMQSKRDRAYRRAAAKIMGMDPKDLGYFTREELKDLVKEKMKSSYGEYKPKTREEALEFERAKAGYKGASKEGITKTLIQLLGGITGPEAVFNPEQIAQIAPKSAGPVAGGGEVLETPGQPGEYAPGYEPQPQPEAIAALLRNQLGVTQEEAQRKALGLPQKKVEQPVKKVPKIIGMINQLKAVNAPTEEISQAISFEGYDPETYADYFVGYMPQPKKKFLGVF